MSDSQELNFKKTFGLSSNSKDWNKLRDLMDKKFEELEKTVELLGSAAPGTPMLTEAVTSLAKLASGVKLCRQQFDINRAGTGETIRDNVLPKLQTECDKWRKIAKTIPLKVKVGQGEEVEVFWTDIPGFAEMKPGARAKATQAVAEKVQRGDELYAKISNGEALPPATTKDVADVVWALKSKAQQKKGPYEKGALTVPNGEKLRSYLDSCKSELYPRGSTHLPEQQNKEGQSPRGMDFYHGADKLGDGIADDALPSGMNTLLFQQITTPDEEVKLYIKLETEGAYGTDMGRAAKYDKTAPKARPKRGKPKPNEPQSPRTADGGDDGARWAHTKNTIDTKILKKFDQDPDLPSRREDSLSDGLKQACKALVKTAKTKEVRSKLLSVLKQKRINLFVAAVDEVCNSTAGELSDAAVEKCRLELIDLLGTEDFRGITGEEVSLNEKDFA